MSTVVPSVEPQQAEPPRIPRVAFISGIAALAFTTGITVALIPALRRNATRKKGFQFLSNGSLARGAGLRTRTRVRDGINDAAVRTTSPIAGSTAVTPQIPTTTTTNTRQTALEILDAPIPGLPPPNPAETDPGPGTGQISPLFALGAFGIATGLVCATAGLGMWGVARVLGVRDMEEFTATMRQKTGTLLPQMSRALYNPDISSPDSIKIEDELPGAQGEEDEVVKGWVGDVLREIESDRRELVRERGL